MFGGRILVDWVFVTGSANPDAINIVHFTFREILISSIQDTVTT